MKAITRVLALLLVAIMMIGMFAGCKQTPPTTTGAPDGTTAGKDNTPTTVNKTNAHTLKVMVQNTIGGDYDMNKIDELEIWTYAKELMAAYGVTLELQVVEKDQYGTAVQTTLAGGLAEMPDLIFVQGDQLSESLRLQAADSGLLATLQDILVYSDGTAAAAYEKYPLYMARSAYNGKNYWFGEYQEVVYYGESYGLGSGAPSNINVREDWLNELGWTETPDTLEELEAYILECRAKDVNGTGVEDEVFSAAIPGAFSAAYINTWFGVPNTEFAPNLKTGKVDLGWLTGDIKGMFQQMLKWIEMGILPVDAIGGTSQSKWYKQNKAAAYATYFCNNWSITPALCPVPEGDAAPNILGIIPDKEKYPQAYMIRDAAPSMDNRIMLVAADADLEAVAHVLDVLASAEWKQMLEWGKEGYSFMVDPAGNKVLINGAEVGHTALATPGSAVAGRPVISFGIFPEQFKVYDLINDEKACDTPWELSQFKKAAKEWEVVYTGQQYGYFAVATPEEQEIIDEYLTDFETLSDQLWIDILLGKISLDDWDTAVIGALNECGMQELLEVYQARFDRYYAAYAADKG